MITFDVPGPSDGIELAPWLDEPAPVTVRRQAFGSRGQLVVVEKRQIAREDFVRGDCFL